MEEEERHPPLVFPPAPSLIYGGFFLFGMRKATPRPPRYSRSRARRRRDRPTLGHLSTISSILISQVTTLLLPPCCHVSSLLPLATSPFPRFLPPCLWHVSGAWEKGGETYALRARRQTFAPSDSSLKFACPDWKKIFTVLLTRTQHRLLPPWLDWAKKRTGRRTIGQILASFRLGTFQKRSPLDANFPFFFHRLPLFSVLRPSSFFSHHIPSFFSIGAISQLGSAEQTDKGGRGGRTVVGTHRFPLPFPPFFSPSDF